MTTTPGEVFPLGPGLLKIGQTGTLIDVSCLVNNAVITPSKDQGDSTTKLCGTVKPGAVTYTYTLGGNVDLDIADTSGLWALSQAHAGEQVDYEFTPNTDAATKATGTLVLDPLPFGGDTMGDIMAADFEFAAVGQPTYTVGGAALDANMAAAPGWDDPIAAARAASTATAGASA